MPCAKIWLVPAIVILAMASARHGAAQTASSATLDWQSSDKDAVRAAAESNRFVLVHFYSPGDLACQAIEKDIYAQPAVRERIQAGFVPFKLNVDEAPLTAKRHGVDRVPCDFVLDSKGNVVGRINCPTTTDAYLAALELAAAQAKARAVAAQTAVAATTTSTVAPTPTATPAPVQAPVQPHVTQTVATAIQPAPAAPRYGETPAASPAATVAQTPVQITQPTAPTIAAYSDDRYAEFYQRWNASQQSPSPTAAPQQPLVTQPTPPAQNSSLVQGPSAASSPPAANSSPTWGTSNYFAQPSQAQPNPTAYHSAPQVATQPSPQAAQAGIAPIGLEGFCPVTLAEKKQWQAGDRRWGVIHRGRTYLFTGPQEQQQFQANPDRYSPAISGRDVVAALDNGQTVEGQRRYGAWYEGRMYLFANETSRQAFQQNAKRYSEVVMQAENPNRTTTWR